MLNKPPLLHQSLLALALSLSLSLSLSFRLIPWSAEALWVHFPARASKTPLRRCSVPSPHREGTWGLWEQSKPCAGALLAFCVNHGISASFSPLLSYHWLRTTRSSGLLKDLNKWRPEQGHLKIISSTAVFLGQLGPHSGCCIQSCIRLIGWVGVGSVEYFFAG